MNKKREELRKILESCHITTDIEDVIDEIMEVFEEPYKPSRF